MVELIKMTRPDMVETPECRMADEVADALHAYLCTPPVREQIRMANSPGASSALIQNVFLSHAKSTGFQNEASGLFANYPTRGLRPDYYMPIGSSGILLEVERGKTTNNNMDVLDFWKCHLCEHANFLFLMVPKELRQNPEKAPRREFSTVTKRMAAFFEPQNYTNVWGLWLFGY